MNGDNEPLVTVISVEGWIEPGTYEISSDFSTIIACCMNAHMYEKCHDAEFNGVANPVYVRVTASIKLEELRYA